MKLSPKYKFITGLISFFILSLLLTANFEKSWAKDGYKCIQSLLFLIFLYPLIKKKILREVAIFIMGFNILCFYYYTSLFGEIDAGTILSLLETNSGETTEFLKTLDLWLILQAVVISFLATLNIRFIYSSLDHFKFKSWKLVLPFIIGYFAFLADSYKRSDKFDFDQAISAHINFIQQDIYLHYVSSFFQYKRLATKYSVDIQNNWSDVSKIPDESPDVFVLILGESARRDAYSFYGQKAPTTPKLIETKGLSVVSEPIAPAPQTRESVIRILALNDKENVDLNYNLIDLAKRADLPTFWISNQSRVGENDSLISNIATRSDQHFFANYGHYNKAGTDNMLLNEFKKDLKTLNSKKLYIFHTMGSHSYFCARVWKKVKFDFNNSKTNCYYNSIHNSYEFIKEIRDILESTNKSYKGIFIADHGLIKSNRSPFFVHGTGSKLKKEAFYVPMIFFDSQNIESKMINKEYYLRDFVHTFATWIGVKADKIDHELSVLNPNMKVQDNYVILTNMKPVSFK